MLLDNSWTTVGMNAASLGTKNVDVMVERNSSILQRLLSQVVRARQGEEASLGPDVCEQLRNYVALIASSYNSVHFHSFEHASHVLISANSLLNELLRPTHAMPFIQSTIEEERQRNTWKHFTTYGISSNPLLQFTLLFAALVHDVQHEGITNRQLVKEGHPLAIRYHDRSVLEQNSLTVAYQLLMRSEFEQLRSAIYSTEEERQVFRSLLIDLLMTTDIGSPEQIEVSKSKWKLAFAANPEDIQKQRKRKIYEIYPRRHSCTGTSPISEQPLTASSAHHGLVHIIKDNEEETCEKSKKQRRSINRSVHRPPPEVKIGVASPSATSREIPNGTSTNRLVTVSPQESQNKSPIFERRHSCLASIPSTSPQLQMGTAVTAPFHRLSFSGHRTVDFTGRVVEMCYHGDECKANAILMYLMQISDVAHTMQDFGTFVKWNQRLFSELRAAFLSGRGLDCTGDWYADQIRFLDSYVIPLANRIKDCGVLGQFGFVLVSNAIQNRIRWTVEGQAHSKRFLEEEAL